MAVAGIGDREALAREIRGEVLVDGTEEFEDSRRVWNGAIDRRPALVVRPAEAADVAAAIAFARRFEIEVSVRGGGHSFAGFAVADGALMIDLRHLRDIAIDPERKRATVGGGATWADLDASTATASLAVTGGFISHTGVAGLTLGGGMGWLTGKAGLSCDNLLGAEVVTATGEILRADEEHNPDLYWALRGGGGNFGVVTSFEFRVHDHNPMTNLGFFAWTLDRGREALSLAAELERTLPGDAGFFLAGLSLPPAPFVPAELQGTRAIAVLVAGFESAAEHAKLIRPLQEASPAVAMVTPIPYTHLQQMFNDGAAWGFHGYEKALYLDSLSEDAIRVVVDHVGRAGSPLSFMPTFALRGAYAEVPDAATAFGGSRRARFGLNIAAVTPTAEGFDHDREWVRSFWADLRPYATGSGSYVNFMSEADQDRIRASYGEEKYARLAGIKARYDPDNVFHLNANIRPQAG